MSKRKAAEAQETAAPQIPDDVGEFPPPETAAEVSQAPRKAGPVRSWTERYADPVRYEVLTDARLNKILIKFKLAEDERTPPDNVLAIMRAAKSNADGSSTGLRFEDLRLHGKVWSLPNDAEGRAILAGIETKLEDLGAKAAPPQEQTRS